MITFHLGPIDKALAHKVRDENVFVRDLRRAIPGVLPAPVVDGYILPQLKEPDRRFFLSYYQLSETRPGETHYVLFDLPHDLPERLFTDQPESLSPEEQTIVRRYYTAQAGTFRLSRAVNEHDNAVLGQIFEQRGLSLSERDRIGLANLLESVPDLPLEEVYHGVMRMDPTHSFFFEHPNEHVPGMMLVEAARQFGMACCHLFGQIPLRGHQFIIREIHVRFLDYVNLNYPATFRAELKAVNKRRSGDWHEVTMLINIIQQGSVCAELEFPAQFVSKRSFQRLRAGRHQTDPQHRFHPMENIRHEIALWNPVEARYHKAKLWDISMEGFRVELIDVIEDALVTELWEVVLYFEELGFIRSACTPVWQRKDNDLHWAGFHFHGINKEDRDLLQTAIRQYCHVRREREHL